MTTFLDPVDQFAVLGAVKGLTKGETKVTAVWVTHRIDELAHADYAAYMEDGKVVTTGTAQNVERFLRTVGA